MLMPPHRSKIPVAANKSAAPRPARDSKIAESAEPVESNSSVDLVNPPAHHVEQTALPTPPPDTPDAPEPAETPQPKEEHRQEPLSEEHVHALFSGAPHFGVKTARRQLAPIVSHPWDTGLAVRDLSDSVQLAQPAFFAATLRQQCPSSHQAPGQTKKYKGYDIGAVEVPSMLSAQGIEPGSIGFEHFLEMPRSDNLVTDLQQSQSSNDFLDAARNKELMHDNPERLGIRVVDMALVYDRLVEFGDLYEAFQDSPERMTILNNQSSGDLYANLFGKFLTPPGYDGSTDDPTGIKVQIDTLLKVLNLKGVWFDFGLVEWRIRLGQVLWSDQDLHPEDETQLWTDREILLFQITLACELLLRLDAVCDPDTEDIKSQIHITPQDFDGFLKLKSRKIDWDLILARRFLENILVVKDSNMDTSVETTKSRGLLSLLSKEDAKTPPSNGPEIILLPQHQSRQLAGLVHFAEAIEWPGIDLVLKELAQKLGAPENPDAEQQQSPHARFLEASTPSSISIYATPLATPRSAGGIADSYFGHVGQSALSRSNSRALRVPLSSTLLPQADGPPQTLNTGGWLSRSYLTGLILPGEAIEHFLISTLLENDKLAIAALGDSASLYGGFVYGHRTWWSKSSIVGRVLACIDGAVECLGWISLDKLPDGRLDGWYAIITEQAQFEQPARLSVEDRVARDSAIIPGEDEAIKAEDLSLPLDSSTPPIPSVEFAQWDLTTINTDLMDNDGSSGPPSDSESCMASVTFSLMARGTSHTFSLSHDIQFITSWPCTPPVSSSSPTMPRVLKRSSTQMSTAQMSRSSSKRSVHSNGSRPMRYPSTRRNSHGFEPLLSHPPDSPGLLPTPMYSLDGEAFEDKTPTPSPKPEPMRAHPLHVSYKYKIVPVTEVLDPNFVLPFTMHAYKSPEPTPDEEKTEHSGTESATLVLDARASKDLELLARAWCAEKGLHAIIGRVSRTCLACCVREARGLGVDVVVRV